MGTTRAARILMAGILLAACTGESDRDEGFEPQASTSSPTTGPQTPLAPEPNAVLTGVGVTGASIQIGAIADLSGPLLAFSQPAIMAQQAYFGRLNAEGGIDGRSIQLTVTDNQLRQDLTIQQFDELTDGDDGVLLISHVAGLSAAQALGSRSSDRDLVVVPASWSSAWGETEWSNLIGLGPSYCVDAMNGVSFLFDRFANGGKEIRLGVISYPGAYGDDGARGAKAAAVQLGGNLAFDGTSLVIPGQPSIDLIESMAQAGVNAVWATIGPADLGRLFAAAEQAGFDAVWAGNHPSYNPGLLDGSLADQFEASYFHTSPSPVWGTPQSEGMNSMIAALGSSVPQGLMRNEYVRGWLEATYVEGLLRAAADSGDLTRAGVVAAARNLIVDFEGLVPPQQWTEGATSLADATFIFSISPDSLNQIPIADYLTLSNPGSAGMGFEPVEGYAPFVSDLAQDRSTC